MRANMVYVQSPSVWHTIMEIANKNFTFFGVFTNHNSTSISTKFPNQLEEVQNVIINLIKQKFNRIREKSNN